MQITISRCGSTRHERSIVSTLSQPGGIRISTVDSAYGCSLRIVCSTRVKRTGPWLAQTTLNVWVGPNGGATAIAASFRRVTGVNSVRKEHPENDKTGGNEKKEVFGLDAAQGCEISCGVAGTEKPNRRSYNANQGEQ